MSCVFVIHLLGENIYIIHTSSNIKTFAPSEMDRKSVLFKEFYDSKLRNYKFYYFLLNTVSVTSITWMFLD